jgi:hypothetical protein
MPTIISHSELVNRALAYIMEEHTANPNRPMSAVLDDAAMRFNLTPLDAQTLEHCFTQIRDSQDNNNAPDPAST